MDFKIMSAVGPVRVAENVEAVKQKAPSGNMFETILNSAIDNINNTNSLLSDAENEEVKFAMGKTENAHDLMIALNKASTALQYTVAVRDKFLEAYKEIMNMQI